MPHIINLCLSKYFFTFETTIWRMWELEFSHEFPVREDSPSDASGSLVDWQPSNCKTQAASAVHYQNSDTRAKKATKGEIRVTKRRRIVSRHGSKKNLGSTKD